MTTARESIVAFRAAQGLPVDGGLSKMFDTVGFFGLTVPIPNPPARQRLVAYHDVHHILGGYDTDERGEALVSAWTLGTGGGPWLGHAYDLVALLPGLVHDPAGCWRAFVQGRRGHNVYAYRLPDLLHADLDALRDATGWRDTAPRASLVDGVAAAGLALELVLTWVLPVAPTVLAVLTVHHAWQRWSGDRSASVEAWTA